MNKQIKDEIKANELVIPSFGINSLINLPKVRTVIQITPKTAKNITQKCQFVLMFAFY